MARSARPLVNPRRRDDVAPHRRPGIARPDLAANRRTLRDYFASRRDALEIVATTRTPSGQALDWVPVESQLRRGQRLATPPPAATTLDFGSGRTRQRPVVFELEDARVPRGPKGTVPIVRRDLTALRGTRSVADHLRKHGRRTYELRIDDRDTVHVPADGNAHEYGYSSQWVTAYGAEGHLAAFSPYTHRSDEFSLLQVALARGSGDGKQTLEGGWQENWWFQCNGRWIGYYPASLFSSSGLRRRAEKVAFYGEIVDSADDAASTRTDMGSGHWPSAGWTWAAYMSHLRYQSGAGGSMSRYSGSTWESHPDEYGIEEHFANTGSWGSYCWVGVPGGG